MAIVFGLDFGTTNTLVSYITEIDENVIHYVDRDKNAPHPSVVLYKGSTVIVGNEAKSQINLDADDNSVRNFVTSPKTMLGNQNTMHPIIGREDVSRVMVVSEVLKFLTNHVQSQKLGTEQDISLEQAVFTIPVSFNGRAREELREAANLAGIKVVYFIHEPLAALYGYIRQQIEFKKILSDLNGKYALVFDWGGGTLDLTVCQIKGGQLNQIKSEGDVDVGGDKFDDILQNLVLEKFAKENNLTAVRRKINDDVKNRLREECETAKKILSSELEADIYIPNFMSNSKDESITLDVEITRDELENATIQEVDRGVELISKILTSSRIKPEAIALCLPTGGMINMPLIKNQLEKMFPGRVDYADHGDRIISEGAAWIAHDGVLPVLSKPIELKLASRDDDNNFVVIAPEKKLLPRNNNSLPIEHSQFYVTDTSDGFVNLQFQSPVGIGRQGQNSPRNSLGTIRLDVDKNEKPLMERIKLDVVIDANYVIRINAIATGIKSEKSLEIYDIDFALEIFRDEEEKGPLVLDEISMDHETPTKGITVRPLLINKKDKRFIAGDIVENFFPKYMSKQTGEATDKQRKEENYYKPCSKCGFRIQNYYNKPCSICGLRI